MNTIPNYSTASKTARKVDAAELAHLIVQNDLCGGTGRLTVLPGAGRPAWSACTAQNIHMFTQYGGCVVSIETVTRDGYQVEKLAHSIDAPIFVLENLNGVCVELAPEINNRPTTVRDQEIAFHDWNIRASFTELEGHVQADLQHWSYER